MIQNIMQVISNLGNGSLEGAMNFLINQNPQLKQILDMNPESAKQKVQDLANKGQLTQNQLNQFYSFAEQFGLKKEEIDKELKDIKVKENKNRW